MISLSRVSVGQATSYYSNDNYYTQEQGVENSSWSGIGAEKLGLSGKVNPDIFKNLLEGKSPDGSNQLVDCKSKAKSHKERAGLDMTFSAPKSVSLTALFDERLVEAHKLAVEDAIKFVESELSYIRSGKDRKVSIGGNLVVARFGHDTARKVDLATRPDPDLHDHCVVLKMIETEDDKGNKAWKSFFNDGVFNNSKLVGMVYQNSYAIRCKNLGYEIDQNGNGTFDIKGFTREQIEAFSKRRMQIKELGAKTKKEERKKMLGVRVAKKFDISTEELVTDWKKEIKELGIKIPEPKIDLDYEAKFEKDVSDKAIKSAIRHFSERDVAIKEKATIARALEGKIGEIPSVYDLKESLNSSKNLVEYKKNVYGDSLFFTKEHQKREQEIVKLMKDGQHKFSPLTKSEEVEAVIENMPEDKAFNKGQADALRLAATSRDFLMVWQGVAGAGKSYSLKTLRNLVEHKNVEFIALAPDASSSKALALQADIEDSRTVATFLLQRKDKKNVELPKNEIIVVDEAGKLNTREALELIKIAKRDNARILLVGDTKQLSAVEAGNPFKLLQESGVAKAVLPEHIRQKDTNLKTAVNLISEGKILEGFEYLKENVYEYSRLASRINKASDLFMGLSEKVRSESLLLAGTNAERKELLNCVRQKLKNDGKLSNPIEIEMLKSKGDTKESQNQRIYYEKGNVVIPETEYLGLKKGEKYTIIDVAEKGLVLRNRFGFKQTVNPSRLDEKSVYVSEKQEVCVGDKLRWTKNDYDINIFNGEDLTVISTDGGKVVVKDANGRDFELKTDKSQFVDHSLVSTAYSSQGKTAHTTILVADGTIGAESMYVSVSRAKWDFKVITSNFDQMVERASQSQAKKNTVDLLVESKKGSKKMEKRSEYLTKISDLFNKKNLVGVIEALTPNVWQSSETTDRIDLLANKFSELTDAERSKTLILTSKDEKETLEKSIQKALIAKEIVTDVKEVRVLKEIKQEMDEPIQIKVGDILMPDKTSTIRGYKKDNQYKVTAVDDDNIFVRKDDQSSPIGIKKDEFKGKVFFEEVSQVGKGDLITILKGDGSKTRGQILGTSEKSISIKTDKGKIVSFNTQKPLPVELSYSRNYYESTGSIYNNVYLSSEHTLGSKLLQNAVNRANTDFQLFTDDAEKLKSRFEWYAGIKKEWQSIEKPQFVNDVKNLLKSDEYKVASQVLESKMVESANTRNRFDMIARYFSSLPEETQKSTAIIATKDEIDVLQSVVRKELYNKGVITNNLKTNLLDKIEVKNDEDYKEGLVIVPSISLESHRFVKGEAYKILVSSSDHLLVKELKGSIEEAIVIPKSIAKESLYKMKESSIAEGDKVVVWKGDKTISAVVESIKSDKSVKVKTELDTFISFDVNKPIPVRHAWVNLPQNAKNSEQVILSASEKINSHTLYKSIDRCTKEFKIYTNSIKSLQNRFSWFEKQKQVEISKKAEVLSQDMDKLVAGIGKEKKQQKNVDMGLSL